MLLPRLGAFARLLPTSHSLSGASIAHLRSGDQMADVAAMEKSNYVAVPPHAVTPDLGGTFRGMPLA